MGANQSVYIAAVSGGNCVTRDGNNIVNKKPRNEKSQFWTIERKDGSKTTIAFRSTVDGKYLRAKNGNAYGPVETGARQWWAIEDGQAHGSYWFKCLDFPNAYLCNADGSYVDNNKIYMWPRQENWTHALTFYLQDAQVPGFIAQAEAHESGNVTSLSDLEKKSLEVKQREETLAKREAQIADAEKKLEELQNRENDLITKEFEAMKLAAEADAKAKEASDMEKQLSARAKDLDEREKSLASEGSAGDDAVGEQQQELVKKAMELDAREKALVEREKTLAPGSRGDATANEDTDLVKENKRLETELATAKKQLAQGMNGTSSPSATGDDFADENAHLASELAKARKQVADLSNGTSLVHQTGGRGFPPPIRAVPTNRPPLKLPERRLPEIKRPASNLPSGFSQDLLTRFEVRRSAMFITTSQTG